MSDEADAVIAACHADRDLETQTRLLQEEVEDLDECSYFDLAPQAFPVDDIPELIRAAEDKVLTEAEIFTGILALPCSSTVAANNAQRTAKRAKSDLMHTKS